MTEATTLGSYFMSFDETGDQYPTDGVGGAGSGSLTSASHLKDASTWILDGFQVVTVGAAARTWTLKNASGTTLATWEIGTSIIPGHVIDVGIQFKQYRGFTIESDNADCIGTIMYRVAQYLPNTA